MPTSTHLSPRLVMICCHFSNVVINLGFGLHGRKNIRWAVGYRKCDDRAGARLRWLRSRRAAAPTNGLHRAVAGLRVAR
jgi:hypothetical protein